jgi:aminomuconate-semialdehyde/2-hydroxymuconate-6-semialdehyde dehydrogenase
MARIDLLMQRIENFINGAFASAASGQWLDDVEPATGKIYAQLPDSDECDVNAAVEAARAAFPAWSSLPAAERSRFMLRLAELIERDLEAFARAESIDSGKPIMLARTVDIPRAIANLRFFATAVLHTQSESFFTDSAAPAPGRTSRGAINYTLRQPRGVAGCISPWNLPLYLMTWKFAPALATGNTVVAKPSELTPLTAFMFGQRCIEAGLPAGALNIVHGLGPKTGAALVGHPDVAAISFTGGTTTGAAISRSAAPLFKKLSLELGGKNPTVIFADADLDEALPTAVRSSFANQGQICLCGSRLFVERVIFNDFLDRFIALTKQRRIGDPLDPATEHGALVSAAHRDKVASYIALAQEEGGTIHTGGGPPRSLPDRCRAGYFLEPTVITGLDPRCRTNQEEIFGPVVTITPFEDEWQAIDFANCTPYGLSASLWTQNLARAHRVAAAIQAGTVWINCWLLRDLRVPFGGMKASGVGREGGVEALHFFTEPKNICIAT